MDKLLKLAFKLGEEESPLWSNDKNSKAKFGHNIADLSQLKVRPKMILQIASLVSLNKTRTNPIDPRFPSLWSGEMLSFYQKFVIHVYSELESRFRKFYELENQEIEFMNQKIQIQNINTDLDFFVSHPDNFADKHGIQYLDAEKLRYEVQIAYKSWKEKESGWI